MLTPARRGVARVLVAAEEPQHAAVLGEHLGGRGHRVIRASDGMEAMRALSQEAFDLALLDVSMPAPDGLELLRQLEAEPEAPAVIVTTANTTVDAAVQAMRLGAFAYLTRPYRMAELDVLLDRALEHRWLAREHASLRARVHQTEGADAFRTQYAPLQAVVALAMDAAAGDEPVLIVGEPGTGKCALARLVHDASPRAPRPFSYLDSVTLAGPAADRVLFGTPGGGSRPARGAAVDSAGTLYLGDAFALSARTQARLARAAVRARLIAGASPERVAPGGTAQPVLVRALGVTTISLPPLRERAVDIPLLADAFLQRGDHPVPPRLAADAAELLRRYSWPGNVAELRLVLDRARMLARDGVIRATDLPLDDASGALELRAQERRHIEAVLRTCGWHQGRAAVALDISPKTLYRKIRAFGLRRPRATDRE